MTEYAVPKDRSNFSLALIVGELIESSKRIAGDWRGVELEESAPRRTRGRRLMNALPSLCSTFPLGWPVANFLLLSLLVHLPVCLPRGCSDAAS